MINNNVNLTGCYSVGDRFCDFPDLYGAINWLNTNMVHSTTLFLGAGDHYINDTILIDLPYSLKIIGAGFDSCNVQPQTGIENKPMFDLKSDVSFVQMTFDASGLAGYGSNSGENCFDCTNSGSYHELKDCGVYGFNKGIYMTGLAKWWIFESEIDNNIVNGIELNTVEDGCYLSISETDISGNPVGISLTKGTNVFFTSENNTFELINPTDIVISYDGTNITYTNIAIKGSIWNEIGIFLDGFDFTRTDRRDADVEILSNIGLEDKTPHSKIGLIGNTTVTAVTKNIWTKAVFTNTTSYTVKWTIGNNRKTYQSNHARDVIMLVSGSIYTSTNGTRNINYAIVKNNNSAVRYGQSEVTIDQTNRKFTFSTNVYLQDVDKDDYFEIFIMDETGNSNLYLSDLNWFSRTI